jgi:hypothetical protein
MQLDSISVPVSKTVEQKGLALCLVDTNPLPDKEVSKQCYLTLFLGQVTSTVCLGERL